MKKYLLKLVFHIERNGSVPEQEFEEQYWSILAGNTDTAIEAGNRLGAEEEGIVDTLNGEKLYWKFLGVEEVIELEDHSKLLFTATKQVHEEGNYIRFVKNKATILKVKNPTFV